MHVTRRHLVALMVAGLAVVPLSAAHALRPPASAAHALRPPASAAVLLRYHFVPGQTLAYRLTGALQASASTSGGFWSSFGAAALADRIAPTTITATVQYHVRRVDATGGADVQVRASNVTRTVTKNGLTTTDWPQPMAPTTVHISADGSVQGRPTFTLGTLGLHAIGNLPASPVVPGTHWTTPATVNLPPGLGTGLPPLHVSVRNVFTKSITVDGQRAAAIDSTATPHYALDTTTPDGIPVYVNLAGTMTSHSTFGLTTHRLISNQSVLDVQMTFGPQGQSLHSGTAASAPHLVFTVTMQPKGW